MPIQNDNTVVQVPFYKWEVRICVFVSLTIDTPYNFFQKVAFLFALDIVSLAGNFR